MMIDLSTIASLELIQNLQNAKSKDCLFGLLNETLTPMGSRFLRSNILQPSTDAVKLEERFSALEDLATKEEMFSAVREGRHLNSNSTVVCLTTNSSQVVRRY
jgi:DNA mismatch repair protein MSH4